MVWWRGQARGSNPPTLAVRLAGWTVFAVNLGYFMIPAGRVVLTQPAPRAAAALLALALLVPLQLHHVRHGLLRRPPVGWSWTLAAQAVLSYAPAPLAGDAWLGVPSFLAASALVMLRRPAAFLVFALVVVAELPFAATVLDDLGDVLYAALSVLLTGVVVYGFTRLAALVGEVHALRAELTRSAVETERLRFSRDLHDVLGHTLCAIALKGEVAAGTLRQRPETAAREVAELVALARQAHQEVRAVVAGYREPSLIAEVEGVTAVLASAGIGCTVEAVPLDGVPSPVAGALAYALREGATNVLRHSRASWCRISLRDDAGGLSLRMVNNGVSAGGGDRDDSGTGLRGLRERLAGCAGQLSAGPRADGSFELVVQVPVEAEVAA
jgi:two-component system sensor histidine kinase DesK